jgi:signal transduction histidine kinase
VSADRPEKLERNWGFWVLYFLPWVAVLIRFVISSISDFGFFPLPTALLGAFLVLSASQPAVSARYPALTQPCLGLQTVVIGALLLTHPRQDFYAVLFLGLALVAMQYLPRGRDLVWLGVFCAVPVVALELTFGPAGGLMYFPIYVMGILCIGLYGRATRRSVEAWQRSAALLDQLTAANQRLQDFAERAEETAALQERNRLARELHDAVTQTIFSITLTAEAARLAREQDPGRLPGLLDRIQESSADALKEMRALVSELRPRRIPEDGLVPTLRQHFAIRERRDRLRVEFTVQGQETGDTAGKEALFRIVQESLNNVVKHAGVGTAQVTLGFQEQGVVELRIRDRGKGFDTQAAGSRGFGLATMRERVESRGGSFAISSCPGEGTEIRIRLGTGGERNGKS